MSEPILSIYGELARQGVQAALNSLWQGALMVLIIWLLLRALPG